MFLNGWKEIARYLGRGVRTVQRWELLGLPVRRPAGHPRAAVIVSSEEIDAWLQRTQTTARQVVANIEELGKLEDTVQGVLSRNQQLIREQASLVAELQATRRKSAEARKSIMKLPIASELEALLATCPPRKTKRHTTKGS